MSIRQVVGAAVRLFGLYLVFACFDLIGSLLATLAVRRSSIVDGMGRYIVISSAFSLALCVVLALVLLLRTSAVVSWVVPPPLNNAELSFGAEDLTLVVVLVAGLVFFANGAETLLANLGAWVFAAKDPDTGSRALIQVNAAAMVGAGFKTLFGLWLVLGHRGLINSVKALRGLRGMPTTQSGPNADA